MKMMESKFKMQWSEFGRDKQKQLQKKKKKKKWISTEILSSNEK